MYSDLDAKLRARQRCLAIGSGLIEGPVLIRPPQALDARGYLKADVFVLIYHPGGRQNESLSLFTDDTPNRETGFLAPLVRWCSWDIAQDQNEPGNWPRIDLRYGRLTGLEARIDRQLLKLSALMSELPYQPSGLTAKREVPDIDAAWHKPHFLLRLRNGYQNVEFSSPALRKDSLSRSVFKLTDVLTSLPVWFDHHNWQECYRHDLRAQTEGFWNWNGMPEPEVGD